jgi:two-component system, cell cycle sensor histidine kinase and response regulator CckA
MKNRFFEERPSAKRGVSLRSLLIYPFVILIMVAVISASFFSLYNSRKAAEFMAWQLMDEIGSRIEDRVLRFLGRAHLVNEINANAIESAQINLNNMVEQELHFWHQVNSFEFISYSYIGHADGGFFGARRLADGTLQIIATETLTGGQIRFFNTDGQGLPTDLSRSLPYYDHKTRPWYKAAVEAGKPTWSPVFIDAGGEGLTITAATPLYDTFGKIKGVLGSSFIFSHINQFLQKLKIGDSGLTFIIERSGLLVATSTPDLTYTADKKRIASWDSENPKINQTSKLMSEQFGDLDQIDRKQRLSIHAQDERYFVQLSPVTDHRGIDWIIVVLVPENDVMSHIKAGNFNTFLLSLVALGVTVTVGFMIARRITRPIEELNIAARSLADGDWSVALKIDRSDEVGALARSFNLMVKNLQITTVSRDRLAEEIEERKKIELELQRLAAVVEHSSELVNLATLDGKMIFLNEAGGAMLGIPPRDVENYSIMAVIPDGLKSKVENEVLPGLLKEGRWIGELQYRNLITGALIDVHAMTFTILNADGAPLYLANVSFDTTERKRAAEALREREERLRAILAASPNPIVMYDSKGAPLYINPAFTDTFGWTFDELKGRSIPFVPEDQKKISMEAIRKIYSSGETSVLETQRYTKDGRTLDVIVSAAVFKGPDDTPSGMVVNFTDISEQKLLQDQYEQAQKMESIGTLAGGIAHDFNNLLMGIQGRASLIALNLEPAHANFEHINAIDEYVRSASDLTKQLLGFARGGKYEVKPIDINDVVLSSSALFGRTRKEIQIHTDLYTPTPVAEADRGQIEQVLLNMYVNAWQAMPSGGELFLETKIVTLDDQYCKLHLIPIRHCVKISVTDTGVGMDEAIRCRIFDPFFSTKEKGRGTGLGLASAYGIVKNHGGMITVYSEIGHGTTFNIYLPASDKKAHQEVCLKGDLFKGSERILLVDDEKVIIDVGQAMLEKLGYRVIVARGGQQAIEVIKNDGNQIDLVILDLIMPGMDGGKTFDRIREIQPGMSVILSSGYGLNGQTNEILRQGCNAFIQKPFNITDLSKIVRKVLDEAKE